MISPLSPHWRSPSPLASLFFLQCARTFWNMPHLGSVLCPQMGTSSFLSFFEAFLLCRFSVIPTKYLFKTAAYLNLFKSQSPSDSLFPPQLYYSPLCLLSSSNRQKTFPFCRNKESSVFLLWKLCENRDFKLFCSLVYGPGTK